MRLSEYVWNMHNKWNKTNHACRARMARNSAYISQRRALSFSNRAGLNRLR